MFIEYDQVNTKITVRRDDSYFTFNSPLILPDKWYNITITRSRVLTLFVNGKMYDWTRRNTGVIVKDKSMTTSSFDDRSTYSTKKCYDEIVLIKGQALWTENFNSDINWGYKWKALSDRDSSFKLY